LLKAGLKDLLILAKERLGILGLGGESTVIRINTSSYSVPR
jgi:hypothetical protein